ncbi:hypothetical protein EDI_002850 [Entamoeba dispar SAW760]|uniref:TLDc domain-containing protein n=1 Tax=Entamoeba dispar (strain ATCC PRA-260 / SAW760) TaxID=370354 RepID=B0EJB2_ENTDS|nr:uncharacterized protein EDI_002850 [Entamoeba dispar SAW760]EDR25420.1 hypothetical protein EDI_002850 [Entamoeba dispar SAW760]|eukprot:EDR25420.1 hypothetical protein EDI_002850 [Entamoeba dispar SAW760]
MQQQIQNLNEFINRLENRRDNETIGCTTNKIILLLKDFIETFQESYFELKNTINLLQNQITKNIQLEEKEINSKKIKEEIDNSSGLPSTSITTLMEWNNGKKAHILFNGPIPTPKTFNEIVSGHRNVSIVIRTKDDSIFGCYSSKLRSPMSLRDNDFDVRDDNQFYVFTLRNHCGIPPMKFTKKDNEYTLARFASSNETMIAEAESCFKLASEKGVSSISKYFSQEYNNVPSCSTQLFVNCSGEDTFTVQSLHIIEWK